MGTYRISTQEFIDGHIHISYNKDTNYYGFEEFLRDFEGDVCAEVVAEAWNKLAKKYGWNDRLVVVDKGKK